MAVQLANVMDTLMQVIEQEPLRVRQVNPSVSADLESICSKCLLKDPSLRYATAVELASDLRRYLAGDPVKARGHSVTGRLASALQRSQYDVQFGGYSNLLYGIAAVVLVDQFFAAWVIWTRQPIFLLPASHLVQIVLIGDLFWKFRPGGLLPKNPTERQMWSIWAGYIVTCTILGISHTLITGGEIRAALQHSPALAAVTGFAFCCLGSSYWGQCYLFAVVLFLLALVMALSLPWAPIEFGVTWAVILIVVARRLRLLASEQQ